MDVCTKITQENLVSLYLELSLLGFHCMECYIHILYLKSSYLNCYHYFHILLNACSVEFLNLKFIFFSFYLLFVFICLLLSSLVQLL
jgi:hypothetical protein